MRHLRLLANTPVSTAAIVLSLALGIGANTAVFSLVNDVLLRSLPVRDPEDLVLFRNVQGPSGRISLAGENNGSVDPATGRPSSTSFPLLAFARFQDHHPGLSEVFAFAPFPQINLLVDGEPEIEVLGQLVSGNYHAALGVGAVLGRTLLASDDQPSAEPVAVISHHYWQNRFGADPSAVGRTVSVNRVAVTVVGVTAPGFAGAMQVGESADISLPLAHHVRLQPDRAANRAQPWYWWIRVMGRLAPGSTPAQARAGLEPTLQETAREGWIAGQSAAVASGAPMPEPPTLEADPGAQGENDARRNYRGSLRVLMALVALVLLAACANVANLLLARATERRRETAMRLALGATRARIVRGLLAESAWLAGLGAALGVSVAYASRGALVAFRQFSGSAVVLTLPLDWSVLAFTTVVAAATALLFGLAPALRATRVDLATEFQGGARQLGAGAQSRLSQGLMIVQIAVSVVLLVGTGLFVRTLRNLQHVDVGFDPHHLALFRLDARAAGYKPEQFSLLHGRVLERLRSLPGVRAATFSNVPLLSGTRSSRRVTVPGEARPGGAISVNTNGLGPDFLRTLEIPLLLGRAFDDRDGATAPRVAIVNQTFAREFFGGQNPVGRRIEFGATPLSAAVPLEIVGLARDARYTGLREPVPGTVYVPAAQQVDGVANYGVRTAAPPAALFAAIRAAVREVDPALPVANLRTQDEQIARITAQERLFARLSAFFGFAVLTLACVGLYGLMSYRVVRRTGEIGLRMALGALPRQVLRLILRESAVLVALGAGVGVVAAYALYRFAGAMLFGLSAFDPLTYGAVTVLLLAVVLLASLVPARRAARLDPMNALRAG